MRQPLTKILFLVWLAALSPGCGFLAPATYDTAEYQAIHQAALDGDTAKLTEFLRNNPGLVNKPDYDKDRPLHLAAMHGHAESVKLLLNHGANVNAQNTARMTALHLGAKEGFMDVITALLAVKPKLNVHDSRGWTPLTWAERSHHEEIANLLRVSGAHE